MQEPLRCYYCEGIVRCENCRLAQFPAYSPIVLLFLGMVSGITVELLILVLYLRVF